MYIYILVFVHDFVCVNFGIRLRESKSRFTVACILFFKSRVRRHTRTRSHLMRRILCLSPVSELPPKQSHPNPYSRYWVMSSLSNIYDSRFSYILYIIQRILLFQMYFIVVHHISCSLHGLDLYNWLYRSLFPLLWIKCMYVCILCIVGMIISFILE